MSNSTPKIKCTSDEDCPESTPSCNFKFDDDGKPNGQCEKSYLGPGFNYVKHIRDPQDMQLAVSGNMWQFGNDVAAIGDYIALLIAGPSRANKRGDGTDGISQRPLGDSFMMETGATCTDVKAEIPGSLVPRSIFVNNIPVGNIPLLSSMSKDFSSFRGLVPGVAQDLEVLNPIAFAEGLMDGGAPPCVHVTLPTINREGQVVDASGYLTLTDLKNMDPCSVTQAGGAVPPYIKSGMGISNWDQWTKPLLSKMLGFPVPCNPDGGAGGFISGPCECLAPCDTPPDMRSSTNQCGKNNKSGFQNISDNNKKDNNPMENKLTEIWIIILGVLGLYILLKLIKKR